MQCYLPLLLRPFKQGAVCHNQPLVDDSETAHSMMVRIRARRPFCARRIEYEQSSGLPLWVLLAMLWISVVLSCAWGNDIVLLFVSMLRSLEGRVYM